MTNPITEISKVRTQLLEWRVTLHLHVCTAVCTGVGKCCAHYLLTLWVSAEVGK